MTVTLERLIDQPTVIEQAQDMTVWFHTYLASSSHHELGVISELSQVRLIELAGEEAGTGSLFRRLTVVFNRLNDEQRHNFGLYFCGYPDKALDALAIGDWREMVQVASRYFHLVPERPVRRERPSDEATIVRQLGGIGMTEVWYDDARCREIGGDDFFPEKGGSTKPIKKICGTCDVREQCLQFALDNNIIDGVWGGLSASERQREKARRKRLALSLDQEIEQLTSSES